MFFFFFFYKGSRIAGFFFFSSRRRHTRSLCDWSSDVCSSDLAARDGPSGGSRARAPRQGDRRRRRVPGLGAAERCGDGDRAAPDRAAAPLPADTPGIGATNATTIVFPAPIDLIRPFVEKADGAS